MKIETLEQLEIELNNREAAMHIRLSTKGWSVLISGKWAMGVGQGETIIAAIQAAFEDETVQLEKRARGA